MATKNEKNRAKVAPSIGSISVSGFKSISAEQSIEIRPLTLLAGANSSGKSSMMQPLLLLKQTLESSYDPGPLLLDGPNVRFTSADQILSRAVESANSNQVDVAFGLDSGGSARFVFAREPETKLNIQHCIFVAPDGSKLDFWPGMSEQQILGHSQFYEMGLAKGVHVQWRVGQDRFFLRPIVVHKRGTSEIHLFPFHTAIDYREAIQSSIHLPGLRGNPERAYPTTAHGPHFPGSFEKYTASIIAGWSKTSPNRVLQLGQDLSALGLTWKVEAKELDDTRVEIRVGRLRKEQRDGAHDLVNIADVGFGVSQTLPVLVALRAAQPGQLLYIEQPEIHLHPPAQVAMASLLAKAANRGVRVVVETHSSLLLLGVQSQVAAKTIPANLVKLHWFARNDTDGATTVTSADMDDAGRFGDWPEDFDDVSLKAQANYLDTAEALLAPE